VIGKYTLKFKNDAQAAPAAAAKAEGEAGVPDTLNTYVMDGAKIQEQLAKMRAGPGGTGTGTPAAPAVGATAKDYAKALDPSAGQDAPAGDVSTLKTYLAALAAVVVVLLVVVIILFVRAQKP